MQVKLECNQKHWLHNSPRASCQVTTELLRPTAAHAAPRVRNHLTQLAYLSSCSWCGCFQWQCGHLHLRRANRDCVRLAPLAAISGPAAPAGHGDGFLHRAWTAHSAVVGSSESPSTWSPSPPTQQRTRRMHRMQLQALSAPPPAAVPPPSPSARKQLPVQAARNAAVLSADTGGSAHAIIGAVEDLTVPPKPRLPPQRDGGDGEVRESWRGLAARSSSRVMSGAGQENINQLSDQPGHEPSQLRSPAGGWPSASWEGASSSGDGGTLCTPEGLGPRAWGPRTGATAHSRSFDSGPGPPLPTDAVPGGGAAALETVQSSACGQQAPAVELLEGGGSITAPAGTGASVPVTGFAAFRAALRRCTCLDELEELLGGQSSPPPQPLSTRQQAASLPLLPAADSLNAPCLTSVFSALLRLPEMFTAAGRRRVRQLLAARLTPLVLLAVRHGEMDAAGTAIMAAALAQMGPDVIDPRAGPSDLLDALVAAGLVACRLPPVASDPKSDESLPSARRYGHSPRSYSTLLYGLAKVGYRPDDVWLEQYVAASTRWLRRFPPRDLAAVAWALAVLQYRPAEAWLEELLSAWPTGQTVAPLREHYGGGHGAADPWAIEAAAQAPRKRADAHSLSLMLWALWRLGVAAPPSWLDNAVGLCALPAAAGSSGTACFAPGMAAAFPAATCQSLALVSYCLARMGHTPPSRIRAALLQAAPPLLQRGSAQDLVLLLVGVAHWTRGSANSGSSSGSAVPPPTAAAVVPEPWLQQLCLALRQRLAGCSGQALVLSLSALAHLGFSPGPAWLREHEAALRPYIAAGRLDGRAAARVARAWARLRHRPGRNVVDRLLKVLVAAAAGGEMYGARGGGGGGAAAAAAQQRSRLSARLFAEGLHGVAVLVAARRAAGEHPTPATPHPSTSAAPGPLLAAIHLRALLAASQSRLPHSYLDEALLHLRAWRLLRLVPPHQWMANLTAVARAKLHAAPPKVLLELLQLLAWPGWRQLRQLNALPPASQQQQQQSAVLYYQGTPFRGPAAVAAAGGGLAVSEAFVGAVAERLAPTLPELSVRQVAVLAGAMAALRVRPTRAWLQSLLEVVRVCILSQGDAPECVEGFSSDIDFEPGLDPDLRPTLDIDLRPGAAALGGIWGLGAEPGDLGDVPSQQRRPTPTQRAILAAAQLAAAMGDAELQRLAAELQVLMLVGYGSASAAPATVAMDGRRPLMQP